MQYLILIRIASGIIGLFFVVRAFTSFRKRFVTRREFVLLSILGIVLVTVSIYPDSINIIAGMMALDNRQYGRLIALIIISNMFLWLLAIRQRTRDGVRNIQFDLLVRFFSSRQFFEQDDLRKIEKITVIIPALNEAENLDHILPRVPEKILGHPLGVLIVDDGSTDTTRDIANKHGYPVVSAPFNRGGGAALRLGYDIAMTGGAKIIVTMDADGQQCPEEIEQLVEPILKNKMDIVIGSRVLGRHEQVSVVRTVGVYFFNFVINLLTGLRITDCSSGFRAFRVESLKKILLVQDQFHTAELIIDAARKGARIGEVPATHLRRYSGESKKGKNLSYGFNFSKTILKSWLRK